MPAKGFWGTILAGFVFVEDRLVFCNLNQQEDDL